MRPPKNWLLTDYGSHYTLVLRVTKVYRQGQLDSRAEAGTMAIGAKAGKCRQRPNPKYKSKEDGGDMEVERAEQPSGEYNEHVDEARRLRRLQIMMSMVMSVISQDPDLTLEEASEMAANARRAALSMFPDKELAYDILYRPRLQRLMNERFRLQ
jgi:hypothetical protein